ncbi:MAG: O-sialoglycoprotein endopeptidase [Deltaproteobacteria bacterium]|nr:O-sialoglycoprotein endopeptidase [Deltaproteobacteria bacterium]
MRVLGIESSCDETAAAVYDGSRGLLSSVVSSQVSIHGAYGGVVPELASREHLRSVVPVVEKALSDASTGRDAVDGISVTAGPGLIGSLLVGLCFAKSLSFAWEKPVYGADHLESHIYAVFPPTSRCWSPGGTPPCSGSPAGARCGSSGGRWTTQRGRRSTRRPR